MDRFSGTAVTKCVLISTVIPQEYRSDYILDEWEILHAAGVDVGNLARWEVNNVAVNNRLVVTWNLIQADIDNTGQYYEAISPLVRYSNNVIVAERPYYKTIVEIRFDINKNFVTYRTRENPNAVQEVSVAITKFSNENTAYTDNEMKYLAEETVNILSKS